VYRAKQPLAKLNDLGGVENTGNKQTNMKTGEKFRLRSAKPAPARALRDSKLLDVQSKQYSNISFATTINSNPAQTTELRSSMSNRGTFKIKQAKLPFGFMV